jgi:hypothetical protein
MDPVHPTMSVHQREQPEPPDPPPTATQPPQTPPLPTHLQPATMTPQPPRYLLPPRQPSTVVQPALDLELLRELEALQLSTVNETPSASRQAEESLSMQFNLLVRLPENQTSGRPLSIGEICQHLCWVWAHSYAVPGHYLGTHGGLGSSAGFQHPLQLGASDPAQNPAGNGGGRGSARWLLPLQHPQHTTAFPRAPEEP